MTPEHREKLKRAALAVDDPETRGWEARSWYMLMADPASILSLIAQVEALTVPQWIETSKRRPVENQQVFICIVQQYKNAPTTYNVSIAYYEGWEFKCDGHPLHTPSHWMPLNYPAAPTIPAIPGTKEDAT